MSGITAGQVRSGVLWISGISLLRDGLQFGVTLVLVRILDPRAYGEYSLVTAVLALVTVISFHSFLEYTLQLRPGETADYQSHFTFGAFVQAAAVLVLNGVALLLRRFPEYAPVAPVLHVMSISFLLEWGGELRIKMLERELHWSRLRLLEAAGLMASAVAAVGLAFAGAGVYALLLPPMLVWVPFIYDLFFVLGWRPTWQFDRGRFEAAWRYGRTRVASGFVARGQQALEAGVLVGVIGLPGMGIYGRAVGLASFCCLKLCSVLTLTLFPMVKRFDPESEPFRRASAMLLRAVAWTSMPAAAILSLVAAQVVLVLYGAKWTATVPLLPWALVTASLTAVMEAAAFLLLTSLRPGKTLSLDVINLAGTALCLLALVGRGLIPYMAGFLSVQAVLVSVGFWWLVRIGILTGRELRSIFAVPLAFGAVVLTGMRFVQIGSVGLAVGWGLLLAAVYGVSLYAFSRRELKELWRIARARETPGDLLNPRSV